MNTPEHFPTFISSGGERMFYLMLSAGCVTVLRKDFLFCSVVFMFLQNYKKKRFTFTNTSHVQKNWSDKFKTQLVIYKSPNSTMHKTYVQSHITHVEPYTVKHTIQITSINTRFNVTIICLYDFFFFLVVVVVAPIHYSK